MPLRLSEGRRDGGNTVSNLAKAILIAPSSAHASSQSLPVLPSRRAFSRVWTIATRSRFVVRVKSSNVCAVVAGFIFSDI